MPNLQVNYLCIMNMTISITRADVMKAVEMLSATIAQHGSAPSFEQLWASEGDRKKLDIWYHSAISDLEQNLMKWVTATSSQFGLTTDGTDYTLSLKLDERWDDKLEGLAKNKVQDYMVHSIIAGWLSDFGEVQAPDYTSMAAGDLEDLSNIILYRTLSFTEEARGSDTNKSDGSAVPSAGARGSDTNKPSDGGVPAAGARGSDTNKSDGSAVPSAGARGSDTNKPEDNNIPEARERTADNTDREAGQGMVEAGARNEDNCNRHPRHEDIDWSGSGLNLGRGGHWLDEN